MKIAVVKLSGKSIAEFLNDNKWINNIQKLQENFDGVIIVHGAGISITNWLNALGHKSEFIDGQRVTCDKTMEVVAAVQGGLLNSQIVSRLNANGIKATGLSGVDRGSFVAENTNEELGFVGVPIQVSSTDWMLDLTAGNVVPVISSICRDKDGNLMNVNADIFTEALSASINAECVFFISDVDGVKLNGSIQSEINEQDILQGIDNGQISDGMIPKLNSCVSLLKKGIKKVWIGSDKLEELFNDTASTNTKGTWVVQTAQS
ncbi:MAG: acetylglutamate kinase [Ignavibacteria bacterium]|jgi:acetylglutamate kinase